MRLLTLIRVKAKRKKLSSTLTIGWCRGVLVDGGGRNT